MTTNPQSAEDERRLIASLPESVATELVEVGVASVVPRIRSGDLLDVDLWFTIAQSTAVAVTILQTPGTINQLVDAVARVRRRSKTEPGRIVVKARGARGRVELEFDADTSAEDVSRVLRLLD